MSFLNSRNGSIDSVGSPKSYEEYDILKQKFKKIEEIKERIKKVDEGRFEGLNKDQDKLSKYKVDINSSMEETEEEDIDDIIEENNTIISKMVTVTSQSFKIVNFQFF